MKVDLFPPSFLIQRPSVTQADVSKLLRTASSFFEHKVKSNNICTYVFIYLYLSFDYFFCLLVLMYSLYLLIPASLPPPLLGGHFLIAPSAPWIISIDSHESLPTLFRFPPWYHIISYIYIYWYIQICIYLYLYVYVNMDIF